MSEERRDEQQNKIDVVAELRELGQQIGEAMQALADELEDLVEDVAKREEVQRLREQAAKAAERVRDPETQEKWRRELVETFRDFSESLTAALERVRAQRAASGERAADTAASEGEGAAVASETKATLEEVARAAETFAAGVARAMSALLGKAAETLSEFAERTGQREVKPSAEETTPAQDEEPQG
ncbi:hypothetical protein ARMA_0381 [Ardenticatena maritima]|uniref:Uncharacterized protein n=1 Tax=Ardenticatena maritima TaxID=872965 RepID=A0A0N0RFA2_9CHLR|nr:hypothetical protein [Ardenticatena maritima]KPL89333.1 hypothetical protein SE16_02395 [Ardenticatena maritima]GAP61958.1 hypothetical protein ARMA_0381 [Ardenticatena maritima]